MRKVYIHNYIYIYICIYSILDEKFVTITSPIEAKEKEFTQI